MGWRGFGFVHHSRTRFYHEVPNLSITIRNFFIAVPPRVARRARLHGRLPMRGSLRAAHHDVSVLTAAWLCAGDLPRGVDSSSAAAACSSINSISQSSPSAMSSFIDSIVYRAAPGEHRVVGSAARHRV
jgi:hypothetical protein